MRLDDQVLPPAGGLQGAEPVKITGGFRPGIEDILGRRPRTQTTTQGQYTPNGRARMRSGPVPWSSLRSRKSGVGEAEVLEQRPPALGLRQTVDVC